jgi:Tfp pilus assembly protein PilF
MNQQLALNKINQAMQQLQQGQPAAARDGLSRVLKAFPDSPEVNFLLGLALVQLAQPKGALTHFNRAIVLAPDLAEAYVNRGVLLKNQQQLPQALQDFDRAIALRPGLAEAYSNRGNVLVLLDQPERARADFASAIRLDPHNSDAMVNLAAQLAETGDYASSMAMLESVLSRRPDDALVRHNRSWLLLLQGDYTRGWQDYEARKLDKQLCQRSGLQRFAQAEWQGGSLEGKTLLLHQEQGLGDAIQMLRYLPLLQQAGARVLILLNPAVAGLASQLLPAAQVFTRREALSVFDLHCPIMSLPLRMETTLENIPAAPGYLAVDAADRLQWAAQLGEKKRLRIGVVWSGSARHLNDRKRSLALDALSAILQLDVEWHSLQREYREAPADVAAAGIIDHAAQLETMQDTAGLISQMDLVISVDTSVAHLAGALGKPCWLLLPFNPDFRWGLGRTDSPWYASMRLFRQPVPGDWASVLDAVAAQAVLLAAQSGG